MRRSVQREMQTIEAMIRIYCRHHHQENLCGECSSVLTYSLTRVDKCHFGSDKPACNQCPVHCYSPKMREKVKEVMRFSGPKMIWRHPVLTFYHLIKKHNHAPKPIHLNPRPLLLKEKG
ncbi:MAG: nitrous oxide-stimulated promoter family protein [Bacteroidota bacterium]